MAVLTYVVVTAVGTLPSDGIGAWQALIGGASVLAAWIEDPFRAIIFASSVGLILHFVDPAYAAPEYHRNLPSDHLKLRLETRGCEGRNSVNLYLLALNELVPDPLRARILLAGAMYRIGFTATLFTYLAGAATVGSILLALGPEQLQIEPPYRFATGFAWLVLIGLGLGFTWRTWPRTSGDDNEPSAASRPSVRLPWVGVALMIGISMSSILAFAYVPATELARPLLLAGWLGAVGIWVVLRLRGPQWRKWTQSVARRGSRPFRPKEPWPLRATVLLDGGLVLSMYWPLLLVEDRLSTMQLWAPAALFAVAMTLAFLRKYERHLHGVYRNQNVWIDLNMERLIEWARLTNSEQRRRD